MFEPEENTDQPEVSYTIPKKKRQQREQLHRDCEAFLAAGGTIKTGGPDDLDPNDAIDPATFAQMLSVTPIAIQTGMRNGYLFGATFPTPIYVDGTERPYFRASEVKRFMKEKKA